MKRFLRTVALLALWGMTWAFAVYLGSDTRPPQPPPTDADWQQALMASRWFDRQGYGLNHVFLRGDAFHRGLAWGRLSGDRLFRQESQLVDLYEHRLMPSPWIRRLFELGTMRIFARIPDFIEAPMLQEMWGVSQSAPATLNRIVAPYTRQIAYHGIHEVGQMFVDFAPLSMACTFVGYPARGQWYVGRTFDFEGGRIFDEEKVVKWVVPDHGHRYVSVIWAGMVGAVSGVNDAGLYVSINAAGSAEFNRHGLPSTLLVAKVLQEAGSAEEALAIFRATPLMITDIFMLLDRHTQKLYRIEKSPSRTEVMPIEEAVAVTNHLVAPSFRDDSFNRVRRDRLTSMYRQARAQTLLDQLRASAPRNSHDILTGLLGILRDKGRDARGEPLHLGNRRAVDALIASHGVLFDSARDVLYVSEGPSMSGRLRGYDLAGSFAAGRPLEVDHLEADPLVRPEAYADYQRALAQVVRADLLLKRGDCAAARILLEGLATFRHSDKELAWFHLATCEHDPAGARTAAQGGLDLSPPYKDVEELYERSLQ